MTKDIVLLTLRRQESYQANVDSISIIRYDLLSSQSNN